MGISQTLFIQQELLIILSTIIDNIYSNNFEDNSIGGNILVQFADHLSQFLSVDTKIERVKTIDVFKCDYVNFDDNKFP